MCIYIYHCPPISGLKDSMTTITLSLCWVNLKANFNVTACDATPVPVPKLQLDPWDSSKREAASECSFCLFQNGVQKKPR